MTLRRRWKQNVIPRWRYFTDADRPPSPPLMDKEAWQAAGIWALVMSVIFTGIGIAFIAIDVILGL